MSHLMLHIFFVFLSEISYSLWEWWVSIPYAVILAVLLVFLIRINNQRIITTQKLHSEIQKKQDIEELNSMKIKFCTDVSHEFKTPLTLILGHLDNLKRTPSEKKEETLQRIEKQSKRLLMLINQFMDFQKADAGLMKLKTSNGNILLLMNSIKESFKDLAERKKISLELICNEALPEVWFDGEKIEKIMFNLLSNAFKATASGGMINIDISTHREVGEGKKNLLITVTDTGTGIPNEEKDKIFDLFYKNWIGEAANAETESSGIGLAYSKKLVELHYGKITFESEKGIGSTFSIRLPIGREHLKDDEIRSEQDIRPKLDYKTFTEDIMDARSDDYDFPGLTSRLPLMLTVDDNPEVCNLLAVKFQESFFVITAFSGEIGFKKACRYIPDIIISDVLMPVLNGYEFCNLLKSNLTTCHIPVILLTAKSGDENQINGLKSGADAYISKPFNPELLESTVQNLIKNRETLRKKFSQLPVVMHQEIVENKLDDEFLTKVISRVEDERFSDTIDVTSLCIELGMSRSVLYRKLKMLTGNSIHEFIRLVKLRKAASLLLNSSLSVSEIAFNSGFINTKHFSTAFKRLYGKTPTDYRSEFSG